MALTGGIGAGKSAALAAFAACGAPVLSADAVVHRLYDDPAVRAAVVEHFGPEIVTDDGSIDRGALGARVFGDREAIGVLEGLLHPRIAAARDSWIAEQRSRRQPVPLVVCEVPLLFELELADRFDTVVVITAATAARRERVAARGQDFAARSAHQLPEEQKIARADHVYHNDADIPALNAWVADLCRRLSAGGTSTPER